MLFPQPPHLNVPRRVVVTGAGIVTPLGLGWERNATGFRQGRKTLRPVSLFDVSRQRCQVACEVDLPTTLPATELSSRQETRLGRAARMLLLAAHEAWAQSGWHSGRELLSLVLGTTSAGMSLGESYYRQAIESGSRRQQPTRVVHYQAQRQALDLVDAFGFRGPVTVVANACASGANAIGHAFELVRSGAAEKAFAGGYDALSQLVFSGFDSLKALSQTTCRPFDAARDGLALGEGAAMVCLETLDTARARGASILGEIAGYGSCTDIHHLTQPNPEGLAAAESMGQACQGAGIHPDMIGYINAHGTGTPSNDGSEARAIARWAGESVAEMAVSSTKSSIGHLLGAAGAVETVACLMALQGQWRPPELGIDVADSAVEFRLVRAPEDGFFEYALTNSFGFGGANASLVIRRFT